MRKETFLLRVDGAEAQRTLLKEFQECIDFAANGAPSCFPLLQAFPPLFFFFFFFLFSIFFKRPGMSGLSRFGNACETA